MSFFQRLKKSVEKFRKGPTTQDLTKKMVLSVVKTRAFPSWQQWKHLPRTLLPLERKLSVVAIAVICASLLFLGGRYVFIHQTLVASVGGEYTEGLIGTPQFVNPLYASVSDVDMDLTRLVFSGLMKYDPNQGLVPDLAESYDVSDDGKTYTFVLRENLEWHDGEPVRVSDVIATISMLQNAEYKSPLAVSFKDVDAIEVDDRTVQLILKEPFAPFLSALTVGIMPGQIWDLIPPRNAPLAETNLRPVGTGPYKFDKFSKDRLGNIRTYSLVRNENYHGEPAKISRLNFRFYPDAFSLVDALQKKNVEGVSFVPSDSEEELSHDRDVTLVHPFLPQYTAIFLNEVHAPALKDANLRKALAMAIDKNQLVQTVLAGRGRAVETPILPGMIGYSDTVKGPAFDLAAAQALVDPIKAKLAEGQTLAITLTTIDNPDFVQTAEFIKTAWDAIGVETTIDLVSLDALQSDVLKEREYDALLSGELLGYDPDPYPFWHSSQVDYPGLNLSLYANRKTDTLIEEGRVATDPTVRAQKYQEFAQLLMEDLPAIFLYQPTYTYAISSKVKGVDISAILTPADRFAKVNEWYVKTRRVLR